MGNTKEKLQISSNYQISSRCQKNCLLKNQPKEMIDVNKNKQLDMQQRNELLMIFFIFPLFVLQITYHYNDLNYFFNLHFLFVIFLACS